MASHVIVSAYGFWLPNDPRGSWSEFVGSWELFRYGSATKVGTRESVAGRWHDGAARERARWAMKYEPVEFSGVQARGIGRGFGEAVAKGGIDVYACAILEDHTHLVVGRHPRYPIQQMVNFLKGSGSKQLVAEGIHPFGTRRRSDGRLPSMWASRYWKVFIDDAEHLRMAVDYVRRNPVKEGKREQVWSFVRPL